MRKTICGICLCLLVGLTHATIVKQHIYNNTQSTNWKIRFEGGPNTVVNLYNNGSVPYMCTNTHSDPIVDGTCQVASHNDISVQGCGYKEGGICITYDADLADAIVGDLYITDPCNNETHFVFNGTEALGVYITHANVGDTGGVVLNEPYDGDITIQSDTCIPQ